MKRISIKVVAKEAGVSTSTVSYVLNSTPTETISEETSKRVMAAVQKLGYVPNLNARSLSSSRSNLIGVLIPQTEPGKEFMFSNPFYGDLLSSIEYTARQHGYHLLLSGTKEDQNYLNIAQNRGLDGIIIVGTYPGENLNALKKLGVPIVLVDSYVNDDNKRDGTDLRVIVEEGSERPRQRLTPDGHDTSQGDRSQGRSGACLRTTAEVYPTLQQTSGRGSPRLAASCRSTSGARGEGH